MKKAVLLIFVLVNNLTFAQKDSVYTNFWQVQEQNYGNVFHLDLSKVYQQIAIPDEIKKFSNIETIILPPDSYIVSFPKWIDTLQNLKTLSFPDNYLSCANREKLKKLKISNPQASNTECYPEVIGNISNYVCIKDKDRLFVVNANPNDSKNHYVLFEDIDDFTKAPCGGLLILVEDTLFSLPLSYSPDKVRRPEFEKLILPGKVEKIEIQPCEGGRHYLHLKNGDVYYFNPGSEISKANLCLIEIEALLNHNDPYYDYIPYQLLAYYSFCDCDKTKLSKVKEQVALALEYGEEKVVWSIEKQDLIFKDKEKQDANEDKNIKCQELIDDISFNNIENESPSKILSLLGQECFNDTLLPDGILKIEQIEYEPYRIFMENGNVYCASLLDDVLVKANPCLAKIYALPESSKIRCRFEQYYQNCDCSTQELEKVERQIERYKQYGEKFLKWDVQKQEYVYKF